MSESNTTKQKREPQEPASRGAFASVEDAQKVAPKDTKRFRLFQVSDPTGKTFYTWSDGCWGATVNVVKALGWRANVLGQAPSKADVLATFQLLSEADRAEILAQWTRNVPAQEPEKAPATAPTKKGAK